MNIFIAALLVCGLARAQSGAIESLKLEELEALVPSQWLDRTGFRIEGASTPTSDIDLSRPVLPLLPLYQNVALGRRTYVGGVIEQRYLEGLSLSELRQLQQQLRSARSPDGIPLVPVSYRGNIYAIRSDFNISYENSTTIGLSLSFGGRSNTVVLGTSRVFGVGLDFSAPLRISPERGLNAAGTLQRLVNDWTRAMGPDESRQVLDQALALAPTIAAHYGSRPLRLLDEQGTELRPLPGSGATAPVRSTPPSEALDLSARPGRRRTQVMGELRRHLPREITWQREVAQHVSGEKVFNNDRAHALVQELCDRLGTVFAVPAEIWPRCQVSASLVPNAWAYPGGRIFISAGLLGILKDVDSAALVLGHEIGHVVAPPTTRRASSQKTFVYASSIASSAMSLGVGALSLGGGWGLLGDVGILSWFPQMLATSVGGSYVASESLRLAMLAPLAGLMIQSRTHEMESDHLGQEVAYIAGADPTRMAQGWEDFIGFFERNFPRRLNLHQRIMRGHPDGRARLRSFEEQSRALERAFLGPHQRNAFGEELRERYAALHRQLKPYSEAYGRALRQRFEETERGRPDPRVRHSLSTLTGPQGLCLRHALGGG